PPSFRLVVSDYPGYQTLLKGLKPRPRQRVVGLRFEDPAAQQAARIVVGERGCAEARAPRLGPWGPARRRLEQHDLEEVASTRLLI
ncbi:CbbQ/NirQ/NorQ C-terminal domain-containing protein, partial [Pseudomonas aeruginosa]